MMSMLKQYLLKMQTEWPETLLIIAEELQAGINIFKPE